MAPDRDDWIVRKTKEGRKMATREVYFPPKEKKIKPFNGRDGALVTDFIDDMRSGIRLRRQQEQSAVDYILAHLEGAARQEIKHQPSKEKEDAEEREDGSMNEGPERIIG